MNQNFHWSIHAVPPFRRLMMFIDGENLVCRYQNMLKNGWIPRTDDVFYVPDSLIWHCSFSQGVRLDEVLRATYYTYVVGDAQKVLYVESMIRSLSFTQHRNSALPGTLTPRVFKKDKKSVKSKGVDIALVVDVLSQVYGNNVDTVLLLSGDGDYLPLIREVQRSGKLCFVSAFSDGLNPSISSVADSLYLLDSTMFSSGPRKER